MFAPYQHHLDILYPLSLPHRATVQAHLRQSNPSPDVHACWKLGLKLLPKVKNKRGTLCIIEKSKLSWSSKECKMLWKLKRVLQIPPPKKKLRSGTFLLHERERSGRLKIGCILDGHCFEACPTTHYQIILEQIIVSIPQFSQIWNGENNAT